MRKSLVTNKEFEVLSILWGSKTPLTAKQIHETNSDLVLSTVQSVIKKLIKKEMVEVADIVYSGKVLTRSYTAKISEESFVLKQYENLNIPKIIAQFLGTSENNSEEIKEIENILKKKRSDDS